MRAVVVHEFGPFESLRIEDIPAPQPGPGDVLIAVRAIGVNYSDRLVIEGRYQVRPERPFVPGRDVSGIVLATGAEVTRCKPGDRVLAIVPTGAYAEQALAPQSRCFVMPEKMEFVTGAALGNAYLTAYIAAVERGGLQPLETVLVTGASGGVGLAAVEIVKGLGATAIAGVTSAEKGALACRHGAAHWVDLSGPDLADSLRRQVHALTGGRGVDLIVDPVGGDVFDAALRTLAPGGRAAVIGFAAGRIPEVKTNYLLLKNLAVLGCYVEPYLASSPDVVEGAMADLFILHGDGKVRPEVSAIYPLEEFKTALGLFGKRQVQGKIVLSTGGK